MTMDRTLPALDASGSSSRTGRCLHSPRVGRIVALTVALVLLTGCGSDDIIDPDTTPPPESLPTPISIPPLGTSPTFDVATWNLLHFGAPRQGPGDESLQLARVRDVILGTDADLWAVQEVTDTSAFRMLLDQLPGYEGLISSDARVASGSDYYHRGELKVGLIYKDSTVTIRDASLILTDLNHEFAGRPPLEMRAQVTMGDADFDAVFVVLHAKAMSDTASWARRAAASVGLERHLAEHHSDAVAFVLGDFNDDIDESITTGRDTPYRNLLEAAPAWEFATMSLTQAGETSILGYDDMIDHILVSDDVKKRYETGLVDVYRVDTLIAGYRNTTSDHLPVLARFAPLQPKRDLILTLILAVLFVAATTLFLFVLLTLPPVRPPICARHPVPLRSSRKSPA